jgi:hypothetical protein
VGVFEGDYIVTNLEGEKLVRSADFVEREYILIDEYGSLSDEKWKVK